MCLGVTCHLHFWQNDQGILRATAVTRGVNEHRIRVSTENSFWRRKFSRPSCRDSNSQPFDHESGAVTNEPCTEQQQRGSWLVGWCFEPSQPQRITSGLKTNFILYPSYSLHESLYHKSHFLKPQLKFCPQFRNANQENQ